MTPDRPPRHIPLDPSPDSPCPPPEWLATTLATLRSHWARGLIRTTTLSAAARVLQSIEADPLPPPAVTIVGFHCLSLTWANLGHKLIVYPFWIRRGMVAARLVLYQGPVLISDAMMGLPAQGVREALAMIYPEVDLRGMRGEP